MTTLPKRGSIGPGPHQLPSQVVPQLDVYVDGIRQVENVFEFDVGGEGVKGYVKRYKTTALGKKMVDEWHQHITEIVFGNVVVKWRYEKDA